MSRNRGIISENLREEIAKELGVYDQVKQGETFLQKLVVILLQRQLKLQIEQQIMSN